MGADYLVLRPFLAGDPGAERMLEPGERVDAAGWRNVHTLLNGRFLRKAEAGGARARFAVVCKPFTHAGAWLPSGALVDLGGWRNVDTLMATRFLREATDEDLEQATCPPFVLDPGSGALELAGATGKRS